MKVILWHITPLPMLHGDSQKRIFVQFNLHIKSSNNCPEFIQLSKPIHNIMRTRNMQINAGAMRSLVHTSLTTFQKQLPSDYSIYWHDFGCWTINREVVTNSEKYKKYTTIRTHIHHPFFHTTCMMNDVYILLPDILWLVTKYQQNIL
jgi:hypothetical protein